MRAGVDIDALLGGSHGEGGSTGGAGDCCLIVGWMQILFHLVPPGHSFPTNPLASEKYIAIRSKFQE